MAKRARAISTTALVAVSLATTACASFAGRANAPDERGDRPDVPAQLAAPVAGPTVFVHVAADADTTLVRLDEDAEVVDRCAAPCDRALPLQGTYRIDGPEIRSSWPFALEGVAGERIVVTVTPHRRTTYATGKTLGNVGGIAAGVGLVLLLFGGLTATSDQDANNGGPKACPACTASFVGGAILMLAGTGVATAGIVIGATNLSSDATQARGGDAAKPAVPSHEARGRAPDAMERAWPHETEITLVHVRF